MNAVQATTFERRSETHETLLDLVAQTRGCQCQAYVDWFTYARWQAQGMQVQRGEESTKLQTFKPIIKKKEDGTEEIVGKRPWKSSVFCRCQVKAIQ